MQKDDPLKRIQEEINEVERRERELRDNKVLLTAGTAATGADTSPAYSLNEKDSNDSVSGLSDDSGISSSSSPINGQSSNPRIIPKYNRSQTIQNGVHAITPSPKLTRTISTPQIFIPGPAAPRFNTNPAQKGIMQRFIASRGRINNNNNNNNNILANQTNGITSDGGLHLKNTDKFLVRETHEWILKMKIYYI